MFIRQKNSLGTFLTVLAALLLTSETGLAASSGKSEKIKAPKAPLPALVSSDSFSGDTSKAPLTVIQFWASWCTGCGVVMGQMTDLLNQNQKVGYVTVSLDETKDVAMKFFANKDEKTQKARNKSFLDASGASFAEQNGVESLPYLLVVDKQGSIIKRIKGHPTKADLELFTKK